MGERTCAGCGTTLGPLWPASKCVFCEPLPAKPAAATCGENQILPPERLGGCGESIDACADVYRCTECGVPFHRTCADRHFDQSKDQTKEYVARVVAERDTAASRYDEVRVERDSLRTRLTAAERERDEAQEARADSNAERRELQDELEAAREGLAKLHQDWMGTSLLLDEAKRERDEARALLREVDAVVGRCSCRDGIQCDVCACMDSPQRDDERRQMVMAVRRLLRGSGR